MRWPFQQRSAVAAPTHTQDIAVFPGPNMTVVYKGRCTCGWVDHINGGRGVASAGIREHREWHKHYDKGESNADQ